MIINPILRFDALYISSILLKKTITIMASITPSPIFISFIIIHKHIYKPQSSILIPLIYNHLLFFIIMLVIALTHFNTLKKFFFIIVLVIALTHLSLSRANLKPPLPRPPFLYHCKNILDI